MTHGTCPQSSRMKSECPTTTPVQEVNDDDGDGGFDFGGGGDDDYDADENDNNIGNTGMQKLMSYFG